MDQAPEARVELLLRHLAVGGVPQDLVLRALEATAASVAAARPLRVELLRSIADDARPGLEALRSFLIVSRVKDARAAYDLRRSGQSLGDVLSAELDDLPLYEVLPGGAPLEGPGTLPPATRRVGISSGLTGLAA